MSYDKVLKNLMGDLNEEEQKEALSTMMSQTNNDVDLETIDRKRIGKLVQEIQKKIEQGADMEKLFDAYSEEDQNQILAVMQEQLQHSQTPKEPIVRTEPKVGRNDPCSCGSGKKYKKCHGKK